MRWIVQNGVLVSADDSFLYVADNNNNQSDGARKLWRFDKEVDGSLDIAPKTHLRLEDIRGPDGMTQDALGRIYVAAGVNRNKLPLETRLPTLREYSFFHPLGNGWDTCPYLMTKSPIVPSGSRSSHPLHHSWGTFGGPSEQLMKEPYHGQRPLLKFQTTADSC